MPDPDGEIIFTQEDTAIERYGAGFLVVQAANGRRKWFPDARVSMATWVSE